MSAQTGWYLAFSDNYAVPHTLGKRQFPCQSNYNDKMAVILRSHGLSISSPTTIQKWKEKYIDNDEPAPFPQTSPFITPNTNDSIPNYNWGVGWSYPGVS